MNRFLGVSLFAGCTMVGVLTAADDRDRDGLPDALEVSLGTDPLRSDTDRDGLPDGWEVNGLDIGGDGVVEEPLPEWGSDPLVPDVFVEIDWMAGIWQEEGEPFALLWACAEVGRVFRRSGFNIHFDVGRWAREYLADQREAVYFVRRREGGGTLLGWSPVFRTRPGAGQVAGSPSLYDLYYNRIFFRPSRRNVFYYVFVAAQQRPGGGSTGRADCFCGADAGSVGLLSPGVGSVVVWTAELWDEGALAGTLLHELGHCFGFGHGGALPEGGWDRKEGKLNYISVMNPLFQFAGFEEGVWFDWIADFSDGSRATLLEGRLWEPRGLGAGVPAEVVEALGFERLFSEQYPWNVDWNGNGVVDVFTYSYDLNSDGVVDREPWVDRNDWGWLRRNGFDGIGLHKGRGDLCVGSDAAPPPSSVPMNLVEADMDNDGAADLVVAGAKELFLYELGSQGAVQKRRFPLPEALYGGTVKVWPLANRGASVLLLEGNDRLLWWSEQGKQWRLYPRDPSGGEPWPAEPGVPEDPIVQQALPVRGERFFLVRESTAREPVLVRISFGRVELSVVSPQGELLSLRAMPDDMAGPWGQFYCSDLTGDGSEEIIGVRGREIKIFAVEGNFLRELAAWRGSVTTGGFSWILDSRDSHFFVDIDGDGASDWLIFRDSSVAVLPGGNVPPNRGFLLKLSRDPASSVFRFQAGNFVGGQGKEVVFLGQEETAVHFWLLLWRSGGPQVFDVGLRSLEKVFWNFGPEGSPILLLPGSNGAGRAVDSLAFLKPEAVTLLRFRAIDAEIATEEGGSPVPLATLQVWPPDYTASWRDKQGQGGLVVARGSRLAYVASHGEAVHAAWSGEWESRSSSLTVQPVVEEPEGSPFLRGDVNADGVVDVSDAIRLLLFLFSSHSSPPCADAADANDSGAVDIADAIFLLDFLFRGGRPPPNPGPHRPGHDPTGDSLPDCR